MKKEQYTWEDFRGIIARLRAPEGCPWDRAQTHQSLRGCMIEEAYEAVDAIRILSETGNSENLQEELGDVLMQVVLHSQIAEEEGLFNLEDVVDGISRKMIYRHPHVFGSAQADTPEKVLRSWEELKKKEKGDPAPEEEIAAVPRCLPALIRTQKIQKKLEKYYGAFSERRGQLPGGKGSPGRPGARERFCRSRKAGRQPPSSDLQSSAAERDQRRRSAGRCPGELVKNL